uniref:Uncharacterized protein n=1 Tax=Rousettus aegyptiacus TaxID=9407 RepID=A0A7J8ILP8_ROUAE|nr:hypothetical protein HJG63_010479 [Rousettus aegyptiacus]
MHGEPPAPPIRPALAAQKLPRALTRQGVLGGAWRSRVCQDTCQGPSSGALGMACWTCLGRARTSDGGVRAPPETASQIVRRVIELANPKPKPALSPEPRPIYDRLQRVGSRFKVPCPREKPFHRSGREASP